MASAAPLLRIETERPRRLRLADARGRLPHRVAIRSSTSPYVETAGRNLADLARRRYFDDDARNRQSGLGMGEHDLRKYAWITRGRRESVKGTGLARATRPSEPAAALYRG